MRRTYILIGDAAGKGDYSISSASIDIAITPPFIEPVNPEPDDEISGKSVEVFAKLGSQGSLVRAESAGIVVDGKPITSGIEKNVGFITGSPGDLKPGRHSVTITVQDEAGNISKKSWAFTVK
jgi:hypothetical protein